ncbi:MAG: glycosyl hydrolase family 28-related protein [Parcubacteria group bacterium]
MVWGYGNQTQPSRLTSGTISSPKMSPINVLARGVTANDGTDDTDSLQAVIDEVEAAGGGSVCLPAGRYRANITIESDNVHLIGESFNNSASAKAMIQYADSTLPVLTIGGGTAYVQGVTVTGVTLSGNSGVGVGGLVVQGAYRCTFRDFSAIGFEKYGVRLKSTATRYTCHILFDGFNISDVDSNCVEMRYGPQFVSAIYFSNGYISDTSGGRAIINEGVSPYFSNVWIQAHDGAGLLLKNSGSTVGTIRATNLTVDSDASTDVLVESGDNAEIYNRIRGQFNVDGYYKMGNDSTFVAPSNVQTSRWWLSTPRIIGDLSFADQNDSVASKYTYPTSAKTRIYNSGKTLNLQSAGHIYLRPGLSGVTYLNSPNGAYAQNKRVYVDSLLERTSAGGLWADYVVLKDNIVRATSARLDTVAMKTALHGVVIDPVLPINSTARAADDSLGIAENVIHFSGQSANVFCTLPTYATVPVGKTYLVINCDATATDSVFVEANGAEFLNGLATRRAVGLRGYDAAVGYARAKIMYVSAAVGWARID